MKQLNFELSPDVLPITVFVSYGEDTEEALKYFHKQTDLRFDVNGSHSGCVWVDTKADNRKGYKTFLFIRGDKKRPGAGLAGLVAHEAVHISYILSECAGSFFDPRIQEPQCYFVQFLVECICDRIWAHISKKGKAK